MQRHTVVDITTCVVDVARGVACALLDDICRHCVITIRPCLMAGGVAVSHCMVECASTARRHVGKHPEFRSRN